MGNKDITEKTLESYNDVFSDKENYKSKKTSISSYYAMVIF